VTTDLELSFCLDSDYI